MKYLLFIFSVFYATACFAQQKPEYDRTRTAQVLSDYATRSRYFIGIPSGPTPFFPSYVPDSVKCGALFNKTTTGTPDTLKVYDCNSHAWNNAGSGRMGSFDSLHVVHGITVGGKITSTGNISTNGSISAQGDISTNGGANIGGAFVVGGGASFYNQVQILNQLRINNNNNSGMDWFIANGQETLAASPGSLKFSYTDNVHGIKFINNDIYDFAGNKFVKSGVGGHANADSLGGQLPAYYLNRANHTGSQAESTITNLISDLAAKSTAIGLKQAKIIPANPGAPSSTIASGDSTNMAIYKLQAQINTNTASISGKQASGNYVTSLTGDGTAAGPGAAAFTLATVNSNVFASNSFLKFAVNGKGLVTGAVAVGLSDITGALGYTPYNNTNPSNFITLASHSGTTPITYNSGTGAIGITQANTTTNGYLSNTDWNIFNAKQAALAFTGTGSTVNANSPTLTGAPLVPTPATSDSSKTVVNSEYVKKLAATQVQYFITGMFSHTGSVADPFQYGTASIPMAALNATGTFNASNFLHQDGTWSTVGGGGGFTSPMTTLGDIIKGGASGAATRLGVGGSNSLLGANNAGTDLEYKTITGINGVTLANGTGTMSFALDQSFAPTLTNLWTFNPTNSASSGTTYGMKLTPTNAGSGTNGYTGFLFDMTNTSNGSGSQNIFDLRVGGVSKVIINSSGGITTASSITTGAVNSTAFSNTGSFNLNYNRNSATADGTHTALFGPSSISDFTVWNSGGTPAVNYIQLKEEGRSTSSSSPTAQWVWSGSLQTTTTPSFADKMMLDLNSNLSLLNTISVKHLIGSSSAPTIAAGTGAGTSPTVSISAGSTDMDGVINVTTGTSPTASGIIATITFNSAYGNPPTALITPGANSFASLTTAQLPFSPARGQTNNPTTTTFNIVAGTTALPASTTFVWTYHVMQ